MRLYVTCKNCNSDIGLESTSPTRWELENKLGQEPEICCTKCNSTYKYSIERVSAKKGKVYELSYFILLPCVAIVIWGVYPFAIRGVLTLLAFPVSALVPILINMVFVGLEQNRVNSFNSSHPDSLKTYDFRRR